MKALIMNSGTGTRMGELTANRCKCQVEIADGRAIIDEQITRLLKCGVKDILITTGPFADELELFIRNKYSNANLVFVNNPIYSETNYIYSIYLARGLLEGDILMLHGDLVFETGVLEDALASKSSVMVVDSTLPLPEKDFKAVVKDGKVLKVGVEFFDDALYAQPLYKLLATDWKVWLDEICRFCEGGDTGVYAENALNLVSGKMDLQPMDVQGRLCFEVDNLDDLRYARSVYDRLV